MTATSVGLFRFVTPEFAQSDNVPSVPVLQVLTELSPKLATWAKLPFSVMSVGALNPVIGALHVCTAPLAASVLHLVTVPLMRSVTYSDPSAAGAGAGAGAGVGAGAGYGVCDGSESVSEESPPQADKTSKQASDAYSFGAERFPDGVVECVLESGCFTMNPLVEKAWISTFIKLAGLMTGDV